MCTKEWIKRQDFAHTLSYPFLHLSPPVFSARFTWLREEGLERREVESDMRERERTQLILSSLSFPSFASVLVDRKELTGRDNVGEPG